jgi:hypothetical protein
MAMPTIFEIPGKRPNMGLPNWAIQLLAKNIILQLPIYVFWQIAE